MGARAAVVEVAVEARVRGDGPARLPAVTHPQRRVVRIASHTHAAAEHHPGCARVHDYCPTRRLAGVAGSDGRVEVLQAMCVWEWAELETRGGVAGNTTRVIMTDDNIHSARACACVCVRVSVRACKRACVSLDSNASPAPSLSLTPTLYARTMPMCGESPAAATSIRVPAPARHDSPSRRYTSQRSTRDLSCTWYSN